MVEFTAMGQPDSHFKKKLMSMDGKFQLKRLHIWSRV